MIRFKQLMLCAAVAMFLIVGLAIPTAAQTTWDKKTRVTINVPVRVGNVILPAGTYVMRLHDDAGIRRVVMIFNADETKLYTTTFGIPDFRTNATNDPELTFYEADPGRSPALRSWFYAASNFGLEFLDGRGPVQQIASNPEPVPAEPEPAPEPAPEPIVEQVPPVQEPAPEPPVQIAANEPPPAPEPEPIPQQLPKTAGELPLLALSGLASLALSLSLRRFVR